MLLTDLAAVVRFEKSPEEKINALVSFISTSSQAHSDVLLSILATLKAMPEANTIAIKENLLNLKANTRLSNTMNPDQYGEILEKFLSQLNQES